MTVLLISIVVLLMPLFAYMAMGATWLSTILPSAGIGMQNNFLYQLANFNYLNIGGMSFWTPHVILIWREGHHLHAADHAAVEGGRHQGLRR